MNTVEGDFTIADFQFNSGETLPELRMHYTTLGTLQRDIDGMVTNAILIMHGTTGSGQQFLSENFADVLFQSGRLFDTEKYYIILPDGIGHGKSSKPSDGLHMQFPKYGYLDMVRALYQLVTDGLGVNHLYLVMGTSMGGMQSWLWGEQYPDFMDYLFPLASLPVEIAGRNRMTRKMIIDSIRNDPEWNNGDYDQQPSGLVSAIHMLIMMTSSPLQWQKEARTREQADQFLADRIKLYHSRLDANDMLYQVGASEDYDPYPDLSKIKAPLLAINSADDQVNPPELGILESAIEYVEKGRYIILPITDETRGHGTHTLAKLWQHHLSDFLGLTK